MYEWIFTSDMEFTYICVSESDVALMKADPSCNGGSQSGLGGSDGTEKRGWGFSVRSRYLVFSLSVQDCQRVLAIGQLLLGFK